MLEHTLARLADFGVEHAVINLHHLAGQVRDYLDTRNDKLPRCTQSHEETLLDTGGALKRAAKLFSLDQEIIVHNADIYCELDLDHLLEFHRSQGALVSLVTCATDDPRILLFDEDDKLLGWENRARGTRRVVRETPSEHQRGYVGIQLLSPRFFDYINQGPESFSVVSTWLEAAAQGEPICAYDLGQHFWIDVGTQEKLSQLRSRLE